MLNKKTIIFIGVALLILSAYGSYAYFSKSATSVNQSNYQKPVEDNGAVDEFAGLPRTEECPLNGAMYPKSRRDKWEKRRPLGIMVQNNIEARPQSGLSSADVLYEAVAEGGITRFLAMYYCLNPKIVGSVRSARVYYLSLVQGYGEYPLYAHVGGANTPGPADALGEINDIEWAGYNDLNQFSVPFPIFWRDYDRLPGRATEHTVYTDTNKLWQFAADKRKLTNVDSKGVAWDKNFVKWTFKDDAEVAKRGNVNVISFGFWDQFSSDYGVVWKYDKANNSYKRENGGKPHIDLNTKKQLEGKDVIVVFADESVARDGYPDGQHLLYDLQGTGNALIFNDGNVIKGTWSKKKPTTSMTWYDENGKEVSLVRGQIWVGIIPTSNKVAYGESLSAIQPSIGKVSPKPGKATNSKAE